jgi:hypothetical protein
MALSLPKSNRAFVDAESGGKVLLRHSGERSRRAQLEACYEIVRSMTHHVSPFIRQRERSRCTCVALHVAPALRCNGRLQPAVLHQAGQAGHAGHLSWSVPTLTVSGDKFENVPLTAATRASHRPALWRRGLLRLVHP